MRMRAKTNTKKNGWRWDGAEKTSGFHRRQYFSQYHFKTGKDCKESISRTQSCNPTDSSRRRSQHPRKKKKKKRERKKKKKTAKIRLLWFHFKDSRCRYCLSRTPHGPCRPSVAVSSFAGKLQRVPAHPWCISQRWMRY